ncbi:hypothetical protein RN22_17420 [Grimontia sp. AD028]|uniref:hypothetical protein n=1 Tax=Grimontia sp. AD028 TaxID=1581149 RepID=UPI00061B1744|nr:hypothetical protein [Grimontia sp. AD028]KKD59175.1 hypothetical protein RN22_17420 [Grimontia sp. AD028]
MTVNLPIGTELAECVYDLLIEGHAVDFCHYGYCGVGFVSEESVVHYTHFDEWLTWRCGTLYEPGGEYLGIIRSFTSKANFVEWLAVQTDHSLSGSETGDSWYTNNQRVTKDRLEHFVAKFTVQF